MNAFLMLHLIRKEVKITSDGEKEKYTELTNRYAYRRFAKSAAKILIKSRQQCAPIHFFNDILHIENMKNILKGIVTVL